MARVLILCEFSGVVRDAFTLCGHEAVSCDLLPSETTGEHLQGDWHTIDLEWADLLIAHLPCTHLAVSGAKWFKSKAEAQMQALVDVWQILSAPVLRVCLENPVGVISTYIRPPDQIIQPWQFGHPESKKTCLWLRGLPPLVPTDVLPKPGKGYWNNQTPSGQNKLSPGPTRARERARTYAGVAWAMASQWGELL